MPYFFCLNQQLESRVLKENMGVVVTARLFEVGGGGGRWRGAEVVKS